MALAANILQEYTLSRNCVDKSSVCHAPESSMYFGRDGLVSACCYSRSSPLGRYPAQSVAEIWTSAQANAMRDAMRRNELPAGCELCADQFYARNFSGLLARQFDRNARPPLPSGLFSRAKAILQPGVIPRYPLRLEFELSNKCNLECSMCSGFFSSSIRANRENRPPLPQIYGKEFVEQLVPFLPHLTNAKFLGGEPFLIDIYYDIWDRLIDLNPECNVSITTNGTVFTEKVKRVLEKLNCEIIVSLDSIEKTTYESIRQNATLERTLSNLESFSAVNRLKNKGLTIAVCPMKSNWREIPELVSFASEREIRIFFNTVVFPATHSLTAMTLTGQLEVLELYRACNPEPRNAIEIANRNSLADFSRQIEYWMEATLSNSKMGERCAELLTTRDRSDPVISVLSDLAGSDRRTADPLVGIEAADSLEAAKGYFAAIWEVGMVLQSEGMLPFLKFHAEELRILLGCLDRNVGQEQARRIYLETRRFPNETLNFAGTVSGSRLYELIDSHLSLGSPATV